MSQVSVVFRGEVTRAPNGNFASLDAYKLVSFNMDAVLGFGSAAHTQFESGEAVDTLEWGADMVKANDLDLVVTCNHDTNSVPVERVELFDAVKGLTLGSKVRGVMTLRFQLPRSVREGQTPRKIWTYDLEWIEVVEVAKTRQNGARTRAK